MGESQIIFYFPCYSSNLKGSSASSNTSNTLARSSRRSYKIIETNAIDVLAQLSIVRRKESISNCAPGEVALPLVEE